MDAFGNYDIFSSLDLDLPDLSELSTLDDSSALAEFLADFEPEESPRTVIPKTQPGYQATDEIYALTRASEDTLLSSAGAPIMEDRTMASTHPSAVGTHLHPTSWIRSSPPCSQLPTATPFPEIRDLLPIQSPSVTYTSSETKKEITAARPPLPSYPNLLEICRPEIDYSTIPAHQRLRSSNRLYLGRSSRAPSTLTAIHRFVVETRAHGFMTLDLKAFSPRKLEILRVRKRTIPSHHRSWHDQVDYDAPRTGLAYISMSSPLGFVIIFDLRTLRHEQNDPHGHVGTLLHANILSLLTDPRIVKIGLDVFYMAQTYLMPCGISIDPVANARDIVSSTAPSAFPPMMPAHSSLPTYLSHIYKEPSYGLEQEDCTLVVAPHRSYRLFDWPLHPTSHHLSFLVNEARAILPFAAYVIHTYATIHDLWPHQGHVRNTPVFETQLKRFFAFFKRSHVDLTIDSALEGPRIRDDLFHNWRDILFAQSTPSSLGPLVITKRRPHSPPQPTTLSWPPKTATPSVSLPCVLPTQPLPKLAPPAQLLSSQEDLDLLPPPPLQLLRSPPPASPMPSYVSPPATPKSTRPKQPNRRAGRQQMPSKILRKLKAHRPPTSSPPPVPTCTPSPTASTKAGSWKKKKNKLRPLLPQNVKPDGLSGHTSAPPSEASATNVSTLTHCSFRQDSGPDAKGRGTPTGSQQWIVTDLLARYPTATMADIRFETELGEATQALPIPVTAACTCHASRRGDRSMAGVFQHLPCTCHASWYSRDIIPDPGSPLAYSEYIPFARAMLPRNPYGRPVLTKEARERQRRADEKARQDTEPIYDNVGQDEKNMNYEEEQGEKPQRTARSAGCRSWHRRQKYLQ